VQRDAALARLLRDPPHLSEIEDLAVEPADRRFDRDDADLRRNARAPVFPAWPSPPMSDS
jgi:hypothetical protein